MKHKFDEIKAIIDEGIQQKAFPGGQCAFIYDNQVYIYRFGAKSINPFAPLTGDEVYDVASLTKVIATSTIAHIFLEKGILSLNTYVSDILKDYPYPIQVRELMAHSSGLPAYLANGNDLKTKQEVKDAIFQANPIYEKNTQIIYSCLGFILLGYMLEKIGQMPLDKLAEKYIFKPLNMTHSTYHPNPLVAAPTEYRDDKVYQGLLTGQVHDGLSFAQGGISGNAGLFSTVEDIALFIKAILNETFVIGKKQLDLLFKSHIQITDTDTINRSLGWAKPANDVNSIITHTGFTGCNMWIDRERKIGFVLLTNAVHPKRENNKIFPYRMKIWRLFYE